MTAATEVERERGFPWPLLVIVGVAFAVAAYYAWQVTTWKVMTDELLYSKLGLNVIHEHSPRPHMHGEPVNVYNQLYPLITAPVYALFDMPAAFRIVHVINAAAMASAAIPAYLLARELSLPRLWSYLGAALAVAIPWLTLVTVLFTESVAYPAFLWAVWAMQRCVARPSPGADALAIGGLLLAFLGRTQLLVLAPILPLAIVLHEVLHRRSLRRGLVYSFRDHRLLAGAFGLGALVLLLVYGRSNPEGILGAYGTTARGDLIPPGLLSTMAANLDYVIVGIGVLPAVLAAGWAITALVRPGDRAGHAFALILVLAVAGLTVQTTSFELRFGQGFLQERYLFYIAPLLSVAMLRALSGPEQPWAGVLVAGIATALMLGEATYSPGVAPLFASPSTGFYTVLDGRAYDLGKLLGRQDLDPQTVIQWGTALLAVALALAIWRLPRQWVTAAVGLAVLAWGVAVTLYVFPKAVDATTAGDVGDRVARDQRDWIDERVPGDATVGIVPTFTGDDPFVSRILWWDNEFWNESVDRSYSFEGTVGYTPFRQDGLTLDDATGAIDATSEADWLVTQAAPVLFSPAAKRTLTDPSFAAFELIEPERPYRAEWASSGIGEDGWVGKDGASLRFYPQPGRATTARAVTVTVFLPPEFESRTFNVGEREGTLRGGQKLAVPLKVCVRGEPVDVRIDSDGVSTLAPPDGREVALRVLGVSAATATSCR